MTVLIRIFLLALISLPSFAVIEGYKYPFDNKLEKVRFEALAEELRCPKCQNQNLADSSAPVAKDLRNKLYELIKDGRSDIEIMDYMVARYGDFVRYKPEVKFSTWLLWFGPILMMIFAIMLIVFVKKAKPQTSESILSEQEAEKLAQLKQSTSTKNEQEQNKQGDKL